MHDLEADLLSLHLLSNVQRQFIGKVFKKMVFLVWPRGQAIMRNSMVAKIVVAAVVGGVASAAPTVSISPSIVVNLVLLYALAVNASLSIFHPFVLCVFQRFALADG